MAEPRVVPVERFIMRAVGRTDVGVQRTQNEDAMYFDDFLGVYLVCDGMGGHASGQVASDLAIRTIVHSLKTSDPAPAPGQDPLVAAMKAANAAVFQRAQIDPRSPDFLSSHPATPERVANAKSSARQLSGPGAAGRDKAQYLELIDGLVYGEDPSEGFVRGRRFLHPKLSFTFTAPEGFTLDNTAQAVFGVKESLIVDFRKKNAAGEATCRYDFVLKPRK